MMPKTKAVAISLFMKSLPICSARRLPSAAGKRRCRRGPRRSPGRSGPSRVSRWPPLFGVAAREFGAGRLQQADAWRSCAAARRWRSRCPCWRRSRSRAAPCRAKDVVISWSPLKLSNTGHSGCGMRQPPAAAAAARLSPTARPRLGLAGAGGLPIWTVRRCFLHMPVLLGCEGLQPAFIRPWPDCTACHQNSPPMPVLKKMLSTDMLPQGLSERQRFMFFAELFEHFSNTGELDPAEDVPFRAAMNSIHVGTIHARPLRRHSFTTVRRESARCWRPMTTAIAWRATPAPANPRHPSRAVNSRCGRDRWRCSSSTSRSSRPTA
mgnify:CR=1 FL=1